MILTRIKQCWNKAAAWCSRFWSNVRPGPEASRGAELGLLATAAVVVLVAAYNIKTGFGILFDFFFCLSVAALLVPIITGVVALLLTFFRALPRKHTGIIVGCCTLVMLLWPSMELGLGIAVAIGLIEGALGSSLATILSEGFAGAARSKRVITFVLLAISLSSNAVLGWLFLHSGSNQKLVAWRPPETNMPAKLQAPNPEQTGPFRIETLFYGAGNDVRRPEYGPSVAIKTRTVNATEFFKDFKGWKRWARQFYWEFDVDKLPLNARVWYPEGEGPFPLALIVHGNHDMAEFSDPGYEYLGQLLASRGIILASVDENFLNGGLFHDPPKQQQVRGWMLLEHLKLWREWNTTPGNPFYKKIDMDHIALMGHSRGGEAAATAVAFNEMRYYPEDSNIRFDYHFRIQAVVAISPVDGQYKPAGEYRRIKDVSYLTLHGAHDSDVTSFHGSRQWDHVVYTAAGPWFKAEIFTYRANHGQFNTVWGRTDHSAPMSWLLNLRPLLTGEQQRMISKTYISAFLEATLKSNRVYLPMFQDWRTARGWLPETVYVNRYQDPSYAPVAAFQEDADLSTTTLAGGRIEGENLSIWREGRIPYRNGDRGYNGVFLGWNRANGAPPASYTVKLPPQFNPGAAPTLELSIAAMDEDAPLPGKSKDDNETSKSKEREAIDFTIEFVTKDGESVSAPLTRFAAVPPPLKEQLTKLGDLELREFEKDWEPVFQSVRIPLSAFVDPRFDPRKIEKVRLRFDRTRSYVICISGIGFSNQ